MLTKHVAPHWAILTKLSVLWQYFVEMMGVGILPYYVELCCFLTVGFLHHT